jgi:hypothetical protein
LESFREQKGEEEENLRTMASVSVFLFSFFLHDERKGQDFTSKGFLGL